MLAIRISRSDVPTLSIWFKSMILGLFIPQSWPVVKEWNVTELQHVYVVSYSYNLGWIKSIDSLELQAICSTSSKPSGNNQAPAMLLPKHSNYYKHGRHGADSYTQAENEC